MKKNACIFFVFAFFAGITSTVHVVAQLKGSHVLGDAGLQSGTQTMPSIGLALPVYFYNASSLRNSSGDAINKSPDINMFLTGLGGSIVTNKKILNANYGAGALIGFASNRIEGNALQAKSPFALTDMYIQPIQLGWHNKRADFVAGYALYLPTGKYSVGGSDNSGLGQWANEFSGGTTLYFDPKKTFNFSALASYALNSKKKDSDIKTGDVLSIEGGLAKTFYKPVQGSHLPMIINAGLVYYMQFKMTDDKIPVGPITITGDKDHLYALGAEVNIFLPKILSSASLRWLGEFGAKNRFQGNTVMITLAHLLKMMPPAEKK